MKQHKSVVKHLNDIINSIDDDLYLPLKCHEKEDRGGYLSIPRQVFCCINYLGALAIDGDDSTPNAIEYMNKYLLPANNQYSDKCELLYDMWRHGTVHEYDPKWYNSCSNKYSLYWGSNNTSVADNRMWHLKCFCRKDMPGCYHWFINLFCLVDDLKKSVEIFIDNLNKDIALLGVVQGNYEKLSKAKDLDLSGNPKLKSTANALIENVSGVINKEGCIEIVFSGKSDLDNYRKEWVK